MSESESYPPTPNNGERKGKSAMGEALARTPLRKDSFDRLDGFPATLDSTPRRFSTGAARVPMPTPHIMAAQAAALPTLHPASRALCQLRRLADDLQERLSSVSPAPSSEPYPSLNSAA